MSYRRYRPADGPKPATTGWDAWAEEYAALAVTHPTYELGKGLLHELVDVVVSAPRTTHDAPRTTHPRVLDFHCGAGDDLARFLGRGWDAVGCDGSFGMLAAAAARSPAELSSGRLELWHGRAEELEAGAFDGHRFDLVFSTTGGFAYLDDEEFVRVHRVLTSLLVPGGFAVIAHLTPFCAAESVYQLLHLRPARAIQRWWGKVPVTIRGESMQMRLRSPRHLRRLLNGVMRVERMAPLLWCTPPFQSGFMPGGRGLAALRSIERRTAHIGALACLADQAVCIARPLQAKGTTKGRQTEQQ